MAELNEALCRVLDQTAEELAFLQQLPGRVQAQLLADIEAARAEHKRQIMASLNEALEHVPRLLRGPVKKIFGV